MTCIDAEDWRIDARMLMDGSKDCSIAAERDDEFDSGGFNFGKGSRSNLFGFCINSYNLHFMRGKKLPYAERQLFRLPMVRVEKEKNCHELKLSLRGAPISSVAISPD